MSMIITGGSSAEQELAKIASQRDVVPAITQTEREGRVAKVAGLLAEQSIDALYIDATTSMDYFTGLRLHQSERLHGVIITDKGDLTYVCPAFEEPKVRGDVSLDGDFLVWEEEQSPTALIAERLKAVSGRGSVKLAVDELTPFFTVDGLMKAGGNSLEIVNAAPLIASCRMYKSAAEIALIKQAMAMTLQIQHAAARIMVEGIDTHDVQAFLDAAHIKIGMDGPSTFKIVLFGEPTAYPHGVSYPQQLKQGDSVLVDTGATLHGYHSDITRTGFFREATELQKEVWELEAAMQQAAFAASQLGGPCSAPDTAARKVLTAGGYGPGYKLPGTPHRAGHGIGMDVHEGPYIVKDNDLPLASGMCFSIEPMICRYGEFGVRLEDHVYMTDDGPAWFTQPATP